MWFDNVKRVLSQKRVMVKCVVPQLWNTERVLAKCQCWFCYLHRLISVKAVERLMLLKSLVNFSEQWACDTISLYTSPELNDVYLCHTLRQHVSYYRNWPHIFRTLTFIIYRRGKRQTKGTKANSRPTCGCRSNEPSSRVAILLDIHIPRDMFR